MFVYGCNQDAGQIESNLYTLPAPGSVGFLAGVCTEAQEKVLPYLLQKNAPELFSFESCRFSVQKPKESTARVVAWRELGLCMR
jgi:hypothetical protein